MDLVIFVRTARRDSFNRSPIGDGRLSVIEPLVAHVFDLVVVKVSYAFGDLAPRDSASSREHLVADLSHDFMSVFLLEKGVVKSVAATENFNIIKVMAVDGRQAHTAVVHLSHKDFVSEEVVTENTAVAVREVMGIGSGNIDELAKQNVHGVVLLLDIIEMLGVLIDPVRAEHVLQEKEAIVVLVLDGGSVVEDTNVGIDHLIVAGEEHSRDVDRLLGVLDRGGGLLRERGEVLVDRLNKGFVVKVAGTDYNDVVTEVVCGVVVTKVISSDGLDIISISVRRLSHHVLPENVVVNIFEKSPLEVGVV